MIGRLIVAATFLALAVDPAFAAGDGTDVTRGHELARAWCADCHGVERGQLKGPRAGVPSFAAIVDHPATTELTARAFLQTPHPTMPNLKLSPAEIDEIVAYIMSLREP